MIQDLLSVITVDHSLHLSLLVNSWSSLDKASKAVEGMEMISSFLRSSSWSHPEKSGLTRIRDT